MPPTTSDTHFTSPVPVDADLQQLYDEVLAGFNADVPSLKLGDKLNDNPDLDQIYHQYGGSVPNNGNGIPETPLTEPPGSQQRPVTPTKTASTSANPRHHSSTRSGSTASFRAAGVRRLPPTPLTPPPATSSTNSIPMPEPEPFYDQSTSRPSYSSFDSYASTSTTSTTSNDYFRNNKFPVASARRLPITPAGLNGGRSYAPGLPPDPRPTSQPIYARGANPSSTYSSEGAPSPVNHHASFPARVPLQEPAYTMPSPQLNIHAVDERPHAYDGQHQYDQSQQFAAQSPYSPHNHPSSQSLTVTPTLAKKASREVMVLGNGSSVGQASLASSTYEEPSLARSTSSSSHLAYYNAPSASSHTLSTMGSSTLIVPPPPPLPPKLPAKVYDEDSSLITSSFLGTYEDHDREYQSPDVEVEEQSSSLNTPFFDSNVIRRPSDVLRTLADFDETGEREVTLDNVGPEQVRMDFGKDVVQQENLGESQFWEDDEEDENRFINYSLLSNIAVQLRDKVPRGTHVKGSIPYPRAFTGKDIVSTIQSLIQRDLAINYGMSTNDRRVALQVARSMQNQLFFYEVEWGGRVLQDGVEDVYMFLDDQDGGSDTLFAQEELPTGVVTMLTRCYSPSCADSGPDGNPCYSFSCPKRGGHIFAALASTMETPTDQKKEAWTEMVDEAVLQSLPESEVNRQSIIHKLITKEEQYVQDLDIVETVFIKPLRTAQPPILPPEQLEEFIDDVFGNILDLRECNRRLLEVLYVRQREQAPIIQRIGDIFLDAATEFRLAYPIYIGHYHLAEKRMKDEMENNANFRLFLEHCSRQSARQGESIRLDLKHFLNRPVEHLQKYPVLLEAVLNETAVGNPDGDYLKEAIEAIKSLQSFAQLRTFQAAMGRGAPGKWEWHDLVNQDYMKSLPKKEVKRQAIIFELIKGEMAYVKDLENITTMYIEPLRVANPPVIPKNRLDQFIDDVFHNYAELYVHHKRLVEKLHEIQREEHPCITSITAAVYDAALNFRDAYLEYIPNYPIAAYRIDDEMANNTAFKNFVEACVRHPDAHRLDMKNFINRPIPRLLRYELLLKGVMDDSPEDHEDRVTIPNVIEAIKSLGKETEPGVQSAKQKVDLWRYNSNLVFKNGETFDMDLLDEKRSLVHSGKLLRQPDGGIEWSGWTELHVLLFDNYLVMTKPKERDGVVKYNVYKRPIPLDLLTLVNFTDPPTQRNAGLLRGLRGGDANANASPDTAVDSRFVYPMTLHHNGRAGGPYILYAESSQSRSEWQAQLTHALGMHKAVQESNKVFEIETLSSDTFLVPSMTTATSTPAWNQDNAYTGKVTCSVPFNTPDGRRLVAIGCAEGVWIGFRHDPRSLRRVLHLKQVTQCAMLQEFGIFLVLADKSLFAYHIEALVPSSPHMAHQNQIPQKLNGNKDVHFFSVGTLHGRTLIIYMKKKNMDSIFRVLEPVNDKINERVKAPVGLSSRLGFRSTKSDWFRVYRDFFLPSESYDLIFLKARIAILCAKGFEIMDLNDFSSATIPAREDPRLSHLAKRCESCRPMGMFRSSDEEFLLCYDEFGVYVDKHGDPSRSAGTVEWEGTAERVALHHPYILLFDSRFIEIRHIETGRLVQIIPGNDIRCIWDGRGVSSNVMTMHADAGIEQEAQVHAVMNNTDATPIGGGPRGSKAIAQCVFELIPTVPLYPPIQPPRNNSVTTLPQHNVVYPHGAQMPMVSQPSHYPHLSNSWKP